MGVWVVTPAKIRRWLRIRRNYSRSVVFDLKSGGVGDARDLVAFTKLLSRGDHVCDAREWDSTGLGTSNNRYYHKSGVCRHVENWLDMYPVVDKATSCYTCPWIYALVHHCNESKRKSQILRFSVARAAPRRIEPYANGIAIEKSSARSV